MGIARSRVTRDIGTVFSGRVTASLLRLGMTVLLARLFTPEQYGLAAVLLNSGLLVSSVLEFGLGAAYIQRESPSNDPISQRQRFLELMLGRLLLWLALLAAVGIAFGAGLLPGSMSLPIVVFGTGQNLCVSYLLLYQVRQDFAGYARASVVMASTQVLWAAVAAGIYFGTDAPFDAFLWLLATVGWVPLLPLTIQARLPVNAELTKRWRVSLTYLRELLPFGKWVGLSNIAMQGFNRYAVLLLGSAEALAEAGRYDVAMSVGRSVNLLVLSTTAALFPRFAQRPGREEARRLLPSVLRAGGGGLALGLTLYYAVGRWLVPVIFGPKYAASVLYLDILMPGLLLPILAEPIVGLVTFTIGSPKSVFWIRAAKLAVFVGIGHRLLRSHSVVGLAVGQTVLTAAETLAILGLAIWASRR